MKKISFLFVLSVVFSVIFASCTQNVEEQMAKPTENNVELSEKEYTDSSLQRISGNVFVVSPFSDGLALANVSGVDKTVGINKNGEIVFTLNTLIENRILDSSLPMFKNGWVLLHDGSLCNSFGKIVHPTDVGVTKFYDNALEDGYVIAEVTESTYNSSTSKIGVMDTEFDWVYEPDEELFEKVNISESVYSLDRYFDGYLYMDENKSFWNLMTGDIYDKQPCNLKSDMWELYYINSNEGNYSEFSDLDGNVMVSLKDEVNVYDVGEYINGVAPILYFNDASKKNYYNYIDEEGKFLFDPVEIYTIGEYANQIAEQDEDCIIVYSGFNYLNGINKTDSLKCYDNTGKLLGEFDCSCLDNKYHWSVSSFEDGRIVLMGKKNNSYSSMVFDKCFKQLF